MKHAIMLEGDMPDVHTIRSEKIFSGITGKFTLAAEKHCLPGYAIEMEEFRRRFIDIHVDLKGLKFDREEADEIYCFLVRRFRLLVL